MNMYISVVSCVLFYFVLVIFFRSLPLVDVAVGAPGGGLDAPPGFSLRVA